MSWYCAQCSEVFRSELLVPVQFKCCAMQICRKCAFYGWVHNSERCWNKECNHRGKLRIRNTGKGKFNNGLLKETILRDLEQFIQDELSVSEEDYQEISSLHRAEGHRENLQCQKCSEIFKNVETLKSHFVTHFKDKFLAYPKIPQKPPYVCYVCGVKKKNWSSLCRHLSWPEDQFFIITGENPVSHPELGRVREKETQRNSRKRTISNRATGRRGEILKRRRRSESTSSDDDSDQEDEVQPLMKRRKSMVLESSDDESIQNLASPYFSPIPDMSSSSPFSPR